MEKHAYIGLTIAAFVQASSLVTMRIFTRSLTIRSQWLARGIVESLAWLDSWPVGLKLNTELSSFFHLGFLAITRIFACKPSAPAR